MSSRSCHLSAGGVARQGRGCHSRSEGTWWRRRRGSSSRGQRATARVRRTRRKAYRAAPQRSRSSGSTWRATCACLRSCRQRRRCRYPLGASEAREAQRRRWRCTLRPRRRLGCAACRSESAASPSAAPSNTGDALCRCPGQAHQRGLSPRVFGDEKALDFMQSCAYEIMCETNEHAAK